MILLLRACRNSWQLERQRQRPSGARRWHACGLQKQAWHCAGGKGAQLATRVAVPLLLRGRHLTAGAALRFCCRLDNLWSRTGDDEKDTLLGAPLQFVG